MLPPLDLRVNCARALADLGAHDIPLPPAPTQVSASEAAVRVDLSPDGTADEPEPRLNASFLVDGSGEGGRIRLDSSSVGWHSAGKHDDWLYLTGAKEALTAVLNRMPADWRASVERWQRAGDAVQALRRALADVGEYPIAYETAHAAATAGSLDELMRWVGNQQAPPVTAVRDLLSAGEPLEPQLWVRLEDLVLDDAGGRALLDRFDLTGSARAAVDLQPGWEHGTDLAPPWTATEVVWDGQPAHAALTGVRPEMDFSRVTFPMTGDVLDATIPVIGWLVWLPGSPLRSGIHGSWDPASGRVEAVPMHDDSAQARSAADAVATSLVPHVDLDEHLARCRAAEIAAHLPDSAEKPAWVRATLLEVAESIRAAAAVCDGVPAVRREPIEQFVMRYSERIGWS